MSGRSLERPFYSRDTFMSRTNFPTVPMDLREFLELRVKAMFNETLSPLRADVGAIRTAMARLEERMQVTTPSPPDPEAKKNTELRLMARGAFVALGSAGGLLAIVLEVARLFLHRA